MTNALVEELYRIGAAEVIVVRISVTDGYGSTDNVIITLSNEPPARERVFHWNNERSRLMELDPDLDEGQSHLFVWFD
jgi:hypothetical protein